MLGKDTCEIFRNCLALKFGVIRKLETDKGKILVIKYIYLSIFISIFLYSSYGNVFYMGIESWQLKGVALISICRREVKKKANIWNRCNQVPQSPMSPMGK